MDDKNIENKKATSIFGARNIIPFQRSNCMQFIRKNNRPHHIEFKLKILASWFLLFSFDF